MTTKKQTHSPLPAMKTYNNPEFAKKIEKILNKINTEKKVFFNPYKGSEYSLALTELVGKGLVNFDGVNFSAK